MKSHDQLYRLRTDLQTRWASPENIRGEKGRGGRSNAGRKGSPCLGVLPGDVHTLACTEGSGTGTEDYAGTAWDLDKSYTTPYQGCPLVDFDRQEFGFYRYHVPDPILFREDIRVTLQQIGFCGFDARADLAQLPIPVRKAAAGRPVFDLEDRFELPPYIERSDDVSSCAYLYLRDPEPDLPPPPPLEERIAAMAPPTEPVLGSDTDPAVVAAYFDLLGKNRSI